jgi:hypothetical protein
MDFGPFVEKIEKTIDRIFSSMDFDQIVAGMEKFFTMLSQGFSMAAGLVEIFLKFKNVIMAVGVGGFAVKRVFDGIAIAGKIVPVISDLKTAGSLVKGLANGSYAAQTAFDFVSDRVKNMTKMMQNAQRVGSAIFDIGKMIAMKTATLGLAAAQKIQAAVQWALNAAMNANPIGIIIIAITALIGLFVLLYNKCEPFRNFINNLLNNRQQGRAEF